MGKLKMVRLGDVISVTSGGTPKKGVKEYYENGTILWVKTGDLKSQYINNTQDAITELALQNSSAKVFPVGTVLVAMYGATIGACSILNVEAATNQACAALLPTSGILSAYIYYYFSFVKEKLVALGVGGAQPNISGNIIKNLSFPLPPLDVQKKIAEVLDKASALIELRRAQLDKLDLLIKSQFIEMFGDPVTNPKDFNVTSLVNVADIVSGITKGRKTKEMDLREVPYMAVSNVKDGYIDWTTIKTIAATQAEIEQYRLLPDDILMTEGGDPDKVGRGAIIRKPLQDCIHQNHIFRVRLDEGNVLPFYLAEYLMHQKAKQYFLGCAKQTTGIASINMKQLRAMPVLVPPIELQSQFSIFVEQVEEKKNLLNQSLFKLELNYKSLMQKCFRGEVFLL